MAGPEIGFGDKVAGAWVCLSIDSGGRCLALATLNARVIDGAELVRQKINKRAGFR